MRSILTPDAALDLQVAEQIMGWRWIVENHPKIKTDEEQLWLLPPDMEVSDVKEGEWMYYDEAHPDNRLTIVAVPEFSTDWGAVGDLIEHLPAQLLRLERGSDGIWYVHFFPLAPADVTLIAASSSSLPSAVCEVALSATRTMSKRPRPNKYGRRRSTRKGSG